VFIIRGRKAWRANPPTKALTQQHPRNVHTLCWHHTVGPPAYAEDYAIDNMQVMQNYHQRVRGWSDIGYNVVIDRRGRVWEGRGINAVGAGATGHNTGGFHVAVMGDYTKIRLTLRQKAAIRALKMRLRARGFRFRRECGHNQLSGHSANACPGSIRRDLGLG
jgi:hypothetical protein